MLGSLAVGSGRVGVAIGLVAAWFLAIGGGTSLGSTGHTLAGQFGGFGSGDGQFDQSRGGPGGIAVMPSTGEVFTVDAAIPARAQRFSADGVFSTALTLGPLSFAASGIAVDSGGSGAVYVATNVSGDGPSVRKYSLAGSLAYALGRPGASIQPGAKVAVDPADGTVYVTAIDDLGAPVIDSFNSAGTFTGSFDGSSSPDGGFLCVPTSLAVDGSHRLYALDPCKGRVDRFDAAGAFVATVDDGIPGVPSAVAADPVSDEVYVAEYDPATGLQITHFSAGGADVIYTFATGAAVDAVNVRGMAVSGAGTVYTSSTTTPFVQWYTRVVGPTVVTEDEESVGQRSAVLKGTINPEGIESSYHFEYGTDLTYGRRTADVSVGAGNAVLPAVATPGDLQPNKEYHYRIVGTNDSGKIVGADKTFTTSQAPVDVGSQAFASAIGSRSARLHGTVNPNNTTINFGFFSAVEYYFEYGPTATYGSTSGGYLCFSPDCGGNEIPVVLPLSGLSPGTNYHFRVVSDNGVGGPQFGADQTFTTAPAAGGGASDVTGTRASLTGTINPHGVATSYHFNYGPTSSYGARTPEVDAGAGNGERVVSHSISGLLPDTTYHVQVVATSASGVVHEGADGLFRTAPAPTAKAIGPTGVSTDAATLVGEVNTYGLTGSYHFDVWSLDSSYRSSTPERPVSGNASAEDVRASLTGLPAGETFVVQLTATSNDAIKVSDLVTFGTAPVPTVFPGPPATYGCGSPRLDTYAAKPKPGDTIAISGRDLGVGANVMLGDRSLEPSEWSPNGFRLELPEDVSGTLPLTVNCGQRSNTVAISIFGVPDNGFSIISRSVAGTTATLKVRVAGPGKLESSGAKTKAAKVTVKTRDTATIKITLTATAAKALRRSASGRITVTPRVRFTPAGGRPGSKMVTLTFKRKGGR